MRQSDHLQIKITPELYSLLDCAAALEDCAVNEFSITALTQAARAVVQKGNVIRLTKRAQEAFARSLIAPPPPNAALVRAFARERLLIGQAKLGFFGLTSHIALAIQRQNTERRDAEGVHGRAC